MLLQENLKKQTAHCLQSGLKEPARLGNRCLFYFSSAAPDSRAGCGRGEAVDALDPSSAPCGTGLETSHHQAVLGLESSPRPLFLPGRAVSEAFALLPATT